MICTSCNYCKSITENKGTYRVACSIKGEVPIAAMWAEQFSCEDWDEKVEEEPTKVEVPEAPNIMIILNSGRDIAIVEKEIKNYQDLRDKFARSYEYIPIGEFIVKMEDISVIAFIGDKND